MIPFVRLSLLSSAALVSAVVFTASSYSHCYSQSTFAKAKAVDQAVQAEIREQQIVGVAVGVIRDGKIAYTQGYGSADVEAQKPVTENSIFNWASNSKPLIAVAALQLVQTKQLDLDSPISTYLSELPSAFQPLTTRQLLCHQSGIPHYSNGKIVPAETVPAEAEQLDPREAIKRFIKSPLIFSPGTKCEYSSHAYVLLSAVVQAAGKTPLELQLRERIIEPLGMSSFQLDVAYQQQPDWVRGYTRLLGFTKQVPDQAHFWKHGAGGFKSNVKDFARFAIALANCELLSEETTEKMWTPQTLKDGKKTSYGLGVVVGGQGQQLKIWHNGAQDETKTQMELYPASKHGVVVMSNSANCDPARISRAIHRTID